MATVTCPSCNRGALETEVVSSASCRYCTEPWPEALVDSITSSDPFYLEIGNPLRAELTHEWPDVPNFVECENCAEPTIFGGSACHKCGCVFDLDFWTEWAASHPYDFDGNSMVWDDDEDPSLPSDLGFITSDWFTFQDMLCCNQMALDCECDFPFSWHDGRENARYAEETLGKDVYYKGEQSVCSACINFYTPNCLPLRAWARADDQMKNIGQIDVCGNFVHFEALAAAKRKWDEYVSGPVTPSDGDRTNENDDWFDDEEEELSYQTIRDLNMSLKGITDRMQK